MRSTFLGVIASIIIVYFAITDTITNSVVLLNMIGLLVVVGGTCAAGVITFGVKDVIFIIRVTLKVFSKSKSDSKQTINQIIEVSQELERNPLVISQLKTRNYHPFLKDGLRLIENGFSTDQIDEILNLDLEHRKERHLHQVEVLKTLAKYPPAFGMIGTVIGLIGLLNSMSTEGKGNIVGPSMAVALLTTLYGLLLANYFFIPMSDNLLHRLNDDMQMRKTIIEGILLLNEKQDPLYIREVLIVHISPSERKNIAVLSPV